MSSLQRGGYWRRKKANPELDWLGYEELLFRFSALREHLLGDETMAGAKQFGND